MGRWWFTDSSGKRKRTKAGYEHEYEKWDSTPERKKARAARNSARRSAIRSGRVHVGDGTSVDHKNSNPLDNRPSNLRIMSSSANAGRREDSRLKGSKRHARRKKR